MSCNRHECTWEFGYFACSLRAFWPWQIKLASADSLIASIMSRILRSQVSCERVVVLYVSTGWLDWVRGCFVYSKTVNKYLSLRSLLGFCRVTTDV